MTEDSQRAHVSALIADDDDQNARLLVRILQRGGYRQIECTTESDKVVAMCEELKPDLLLLDVSMPSPNGFEIMELLAQIDGVDPVVVILTGHAHPSIEGRAFDLGAAAVVGKTTSMTDLLERLDQVLARAGRIPEEDTGS